MTPCHRMPKNGSHPVPATERSVFFFWVTIERFRKYPQILENDTHPYTQMICCCNFQLNSIKGSPSLLLLMPPKPITLPVPYSLVYSMLDYNSMSYSGMPCFKEVSGKMSKKNPKRYSITSYRKREQWAKV